MTGWLRLGKRAGVCWPGPSALSCMSDRPWGQARGMPTVAGSSRRNTVFGVRQASSGFFQPFTLKAHQVRVSIHESPAFPTKEKGVTLCISFPVYRTGWAAVRTSTDVPRPPRSAWHEAGTQDMLASLPPSDLEFGERLLGRLDETEGLKLPLLKTDWALLALPSLPQPVLSLHFCRSLGFPAGAQPPFLGGKRRFTLNSM